MDPSIIYMGLNIVGATSIGIYAWENRFGTLTGKSLRERLNETSNIFTQTYEKISPTLEHFAYGFVHTSYGFAIQNFVEAVPPPITLVNPSFYPNLCISLCVSYDFFWESKQALKRKQILPEQFLGTCAGVMTSVALNNLPQIMLGINVLKEIMQQYVS